MEFIFKFDESATNLILRGLAELPYKQSAGLIQGIQDEVRKQLQPQLAQEPEGGRATNADGGDANDAQPPAVTE